MTLRPSIVCPVDFSETSRIALQYAAAIADHFGAGITVMSVDDPLLAAVTAHSGYELPLSTATERELQRFVDATLAPAPGGPRTLDVTVSVGKPAAEILRVARERAADLIVMSSQGRSGVSRRFFGSTTEAVLRTTGVPVLVTPRTNEHVGSLSEIALMIRRIVAPVDLSEASRRQLTIAAGLGVSLDVPVIVPYVLEPVFVPPAVRGAAPGIDAERRAGAEGRLVQLVGGLSIRARTETLILSGDPSEEIVKLAGARDAGLIVMGLHSSSLLGPRMGSVTYRVLCMAHALVLAIPPVPAPSFQTAGEDTLTIANG
jgi:nucleotide-binding universal stress UspA family protein